MVKQNGLDRQNDGVEEREAVFQQEQQPFDRVNQLRQQGAILLKYSRARHQIFIASWLLLCG